MIVGYFRHQTHNRLGKGIQPLVCLWVEFFLFSSVDCDPEVFLPDPKALSVAHCKGLNQVNEVRREGLGYYMMSSISAPS